MKTANQLVSDANGQIETLAADEAIKLMDDGKVVFVDLREPSEVEKGSLPRGLLEFQVVTRSPSHNPKLGAGKKLVLYCGSERALRVGRQRLDELHERSPRRRRFSCAAEGSGREQAGSTSQKSTELRTLRIAARSHMIEPPGIYQIEGWSKRRGKLIGIVAHDRQPAAPFGAVRSESRDDHVTTGTYGLLQATDVRISVGRLRQKVKSGAQAGELFWFGAHQHQETKMVDLANTGSHELFCPAQSRSRHERAPGHRDRLLSHMQGRLAGSRRTRQNHRVQRECRGASRTDAALRVAGRSATWAALPVPGSLP